MCSLTLRVLQVLYGPHCLPDDTLKEEDKFSTPNDLSPELTVQCWFRFLHLLGTPVALSIPDKITNNQYFMQYALEQGSSPTDHVSIRSLPDSFLRAMKGVSLLVDMFLDVRYIKQGGPGESHETKIEDFHNLGKLNKEGATLSPSTSLDMISSILTVPGPTSPDATTGDQSFPGVEKAQSRLRASCVGPGVNSILHIFGSWLFDATLSGVDMKKILQSFGSLAKELTNPTTSPARRYSSSQSN